MKWKPNRHCSASRLANVVFVALVSPTVALAQAGAPIDWSAVETSIETEAGLLPHDSGDLNVFTIDESLGQRSGQHLFHRFLHFDVGPGDTALFTASGSTATVVSYVEGDSASKIGGALESTIAGADFYFLNPNGVFFGPGASLDIRGAAHFSSAEDGGFANGMRLVVAPAGGGPPVLEMASLESFGFVGAPIRLDGTAVFFGNVDPGYKKVDGEVSLRGGDIEIADGGGFIGIDRDVTVVGSGEVLLNGRDGSGFGSGVNLANHSGQAGSVRIQGRRVELTDSASVVTENAGATCAGAGSCGGSVVIEAAEEIVLHGTAPGEEGTTTRGKDIFGPGFSLPLSPGLGSVDLLTLNQTSAAGAGTIELRAPVVRILDGADVTTVTAGASAQGTISLVAPELLEISGLGADGVGSRVRSQSVTTLDGAAGNIEVVVGTVQLRDGGTLAANTSGNTPGGNLSVVASQLVSISGQDLSGAGSAPQPSTLQTAQVDSAGTGAGGSITIDAPRVTLSDGGEILALSVGLGGAAGAIEVTADAVELSGSSEISVFAVQGPPVPPGLGPGDPSPPGAVDGNISIRTSDYLLLEDGSQIEASVDEGLGGSIFIGGVGEGESAEGLVLRGDSAILAQARTSSGLDARGGDISISANTVLVCPDCLINADGPTSSSAGSVVINNPETAIESQVVPPQVAYLDASAQLLAECGREVGGGRFTVANWPGLSISADEPLLQRSPSRSTSPPGSSPGNEAPTTPVPPNESPTADRAADLNAQGHAQVRAGDFAGALSRYRASAEQARGQKQELLAAQAEANAARVALILGENREAKSALGRARESLDQADASLSEEATLRIHLAESEAALAKRDSSQRVEGLLAAHADLVRALEAAEESGERRIASHALGQLGALYGDEAGRDREAIHLTLRALRLAEEERAVDLLARYYAQLGALEWQSGNTAASLDATRRAVSLLEETRPEARGTAARADAVFRQNVEPVYLALVDRLLQASGDGPTPGSRPVLLDEARYVVEQWKAAELRNYFHDSCAAELAATARSVESLDPHAAVIYPIALPDRLEILVSRASGIARITVPLSQAELEAEVETFRNLLTKRVTYDYEASARKLHTWLVDPYLPLLEEESIETLVFVPSGALRTIPMAALHDGDRFLVERFALALTPSLDLLAPKPLQPGQTDLLIAGVSEAVQGYPGLPGVAEEIAAIEALYGGTVLLDADFDPAHFEAALRNDRPGIVHLASHAEITGDPDTSFVLTHDGRLSIEELAALVRSGRYGDEPLELLVLSACETAISDERAALGLAGVAIRAGARSAMGSLWSVSDQAAFRLVASFYQALNTPGTSKARALQSAQKTLLADRRFQHPYYWASFLVMNNWL